MHASEIKAGLSQSGWTQRRVAADVGVKETVVSAVVNGRARSQRIEQHISDITGIPLYNLWPQWHDAPPGVPKDFDPLQLNADLLERVERNLASEIKRRAPGLHGHLRIQGRHRAAVYNACVKRGTGAIETPAGIGRVVDDYLDGWELDYRLTTGDEPTPAALAKWALYEDAPTQPPAAGHTITADSSSIASMGNVTLGNVNMRGGKSRKPK